MALVRSRGGKSTERKVRALLMRRGVRGWTMNDASVPGCPDFVFHSQKRALFIDGCFWHGCPVCRRPMPRANARYWRSKIHGNVARAKLIDKTLKARGFRVTRLWEHELRPGVWTRVVPKLLAILS